MGVVIILTSIFCLLNRPECVTLFHLNYFYTSHCLKGKVHYANLSIKVPHSLATAQFSNIISHQYFLWVYNPGVKSCLYTPSYSSILCLWVMLKQAKECQGLSGHIRSFKSQDDFSPTAVSKIMALLTPWFRTSCLQYYKFLLF